MRPKNDVTSSHDRSAQKGHKLNYGSFAFEIATTTFEDLTLLFRRKQKHLCSILGYFSSLHGTPQIVSCWIGPWCVPSLFRGSLLSIGQGCTQAPIHSILPLALRFSGHGPYRRPHSWPRIHHRKTRMIPTRTTR